MVRTDGRSVGVRSRDYQFFWDGLIYLAMGLRPRAREAVKLGEGISEYSVQWKAQEVSRR